MLILIWSFKAKLDVCEARMSKTASWTGELNHKLGGARKITSGSLIMDRDLNGVRGILLRTLVNNPGSVNTDLADADAFLADIKRSGAEALTPPI